MARIGESLVTIGLLCKGALAIPPHGGAASGRPFDADLPASHCHDGAGKRPAQSGLPPHGFIEVFKLPKFDGPLVARVRDGAAEEPESDLGGQRAKSIRVEGDRAAPWPGRGGERRPRRPNGKFNRRLGPPHPVGKPHETLRA